MNWFFKSFALTAFWLTLGGSAAAALPAPLAQALARTPISPDAVSVWVSPAGVDTPVVAHRADALMQPASSIKVVTTLASLDIFGPAYTWKTQVRAQAWPDKTGRVRAVCFVGSGDPHLMVEQLWLLVEHLRQVGVREIVGDITADRSAFDVPAVAPGAFDGAADRSYNVGADAALVNLKSVSIRFEPEENGRWARVTALPRLQGFAVPARVPLLKGACGDWKGALKVRYTQTGVRFDGGLPASCGPKALHAARWGSDEYLTRVLRPMLTQAGIVWKGKAKDGNAASGGVRLAELESAPMSNVVTWVNKFSNNTMTRHLFLTLSRSDDRGEAQPATPARSRAVLNAWLEKAIGAVPAGTYIDNGSGLSRQTRISAATLGRVLNYGFHSYVMPEFMASLPSAGFDGTMRKRALKTGSAHIKTGLIRDVRSIAGYVTDVQGRRWSVAVMINGTNLANDKLFTQAVLNWCAQGGAQALRREKAAKH